MDGDIFLLEVAQGNPLSWDFREGKTGYRGPGKVFFPSPRRLRPSIPIRAAPQGIPAGGIPPAPQAWLRMGFDPRGDRLPSSPRWISLLLLRLFPFSLWFAEPLWVTGCFCPELGLSSEPCRRFSPKPSPKTPVGLWKGSDPRDLGPKKPQNPWVTPALDPSPARIPPTLSLQLRTRRGLGFSPGVPGIWAHSAQFPAPPARGAKPGSRRLPVCHSTRPAGNF